ncbi:gamma-glutamyl-gamma-aminobutyrate hydrolase family protein [Kitasatospora sp. NPDC057198]|uniref:gamma-glutamyl-gamma-aminobutyrate hydrolase family protein n=1 Tax=Kitasatospora sp. NPDC057198 TaxID=3346046 RepID=UPI003637F50D
MSTTGHPAPLIGIPVRLSDGDAPGADERIGEANRIFEQVVALVRAAGAEPVLLEPHSGDGPPDGRLAGCAGFVVPGGGDVDPALYGADPGHPALYDVNPAQDRLDIAVLRHALDNRRPVLGICRGMQLLNVLRGGTLHVDLAPTAVTHNPEPGTEWAVHEVELSAGSALAGAFGRDRIAVASGHHQAVDRVGEGLRVSGRADDGCVEAVEATADPRSAWAVGVQWHPEALVPDPELRLPLFRALLAQVEAEADVRRKAEVRS